MKCQKCSNQISYNTSYCPHCGNKIFKKDQLNDNAVRSNPFGIMAMICFLLLISLLGILLLFHIQNYLTLLFVLPIILGIVGVLRQRKSDSDEDESGVAYGISAAVMSTFILLIMLSGIL